MPIFEYLCTACNRIYSFLSFSTKPKREPTCPRCGNASLTRVPSAFSVARKRTSASSAKAEQEGIPQALESEVEKLLANVNEKDMEDPRTMARVMRRLAEASGEPVPDTLQEMMQRLEAGEDPEKLEEELGDQLEEELGDEDLEAEHFDSAAPERDPSLYSL